MTPGDVGGRLMLAKRRAASENHQLYFVLRGVGNDMDDCQLRLGRKRSPELKTGSYAHARAEAVAGTDN